MKEHVAIKKLSNIENEIDAKRILREIRIMRYMAHPNVSLLKNVIYWQKDDE